MADRPLKGRRIVVTRPRQQAEQLAKALKNLGALVFVVPLVEIRSAQDLDANARADPGGYDWVVFTSVNAVATVGAGVRISSGDFRVAAVGPATADSVRALGVEPAFVPHRHASDAIADGLEPLVGVRVLLPQADIADPGLAAELRARGATVDVVVAYRTVEVEPVAEGIRALEQADAIVLASGSAARNLGRLARNVLQTGDALILCIGPKTADVAREAGLPVGLVAHEATSEGIIHALTSHFGEGK